MYSHMNTKALHLIYGITLLIILPIVAYMFLTNRSVTSESKKQVERLDSLEGKYFQLETINKMLQKEVADVGQQKEATSALEPAKKTETNSPDKKATRINVLNARGLAGVAGKVQAKLDTAGYAVQNVDNTTWQVDSTITARAGFERSAEDIRAVLKDEYTFAKVGPLPTDETEYDVIITIGQN